MDLKENIILSKDAEPHLTVKKMDMLSDMICQIVDSAEFLRNIHPNPIWTEVADEIYIGYGTFLGDLNTSKELHDILEDLLSSEYGRNQMSTQEKIVANLFLNDFKKYGVHLNDRNRKYLIKLNDEIQSLSYNFSRLDSKSPRAKIYHLEQLLESRRKLASLLNHETYSHFYLRDKMSKNPDRVISFLSRKHSENNPKVEHELQLLRSLRKDSSAAIYEVFSSDRKQMFKYLNAHNSLPFPIREYFTVGNVIAGASRLFNLMFGVRFEPENIEPGEVWSESVRKLSVIDESNGKLGTIYMDLFQRDYHQVQKFNFAAAFTIRCSRRIDNDIPGIFDSEDYKSNEEFGLYKECGKSFQLPIIALSFNFEAPKDEMPSFLSFNQVEVLLHELGHAMHSMFARTEYQHVSGTRCKLDFVEVPSVFMELMLRNASISSLLSKHYITEESVPFEQMSKWSDAFHGFQALDEQVQIFCSALDLNYHNIRQNEKINSTEILKHTFEKFHVLPYVPGTFSQTDFNHLGGYGSVYYSYLWSKEIASHIYDGFFKQALNPNNGEINLDQLRNAGEIFKTEVLCHGGGKDPWEMRWDKFGGKNLIDKFI